MFFVGCLLLGIGLGLLIGHTVAGLLIGLGFGFIVEGAVSKLKSAGRQNHSHL